MGCESEKGKRDRSNQTMTGQEHPGLQNFAGFESLCPSTLSHVQTEHTVEEEFK